MKYKNRKARILPDGSLAEKKLGRRRGVDRAEAAQLYEMLLQAIELTGKRGISFSHLVRDLHIRSEKNLERMLDKAMREGKIVRKEGRFYRLPDKNKKTAGRGTQREAKILRLKKTFAFAELLDAPDEPDVFIPGSKLHGALPGDTVLLQIHKGEDGQLDDGEVLRITVPGDAVFTGVARTLGRRAYAEIPQLSDEPMPLIGAKDVSDGDRVCVQIERRGEHHRDMTARLLQNYGDSEIAANCAASILDAAGITPDFPADVRAEAEYLYRRGVQEDVGEQRLDLRQWCIFTIDGAESKDLDDAISLSKTDDEWLLGVHIADVSHYVREGSALDREAFRRGTSIYYADKVVPMLPKELSNGICSLNPGEDRLAFSALMTLSTDGQLLDFDFKKTIIRSRVKGVYSEINRLLDGDEDAALREKYADILSVLPKMAELAKLRAKLREERGVPDIDSAESKLILDENGRCVGVQPRERGFAEGMIEEFMLLANESAAQLGRMLDIPFVYRVHEKPDSKKLDTLREILKALGEDTSMLRGEVAPAALRDVLLSTEDKPYKTLLHRQVLRSMMKAKYDPKPLGHYGLVLEDYAHFTSPIRRYPDLAIHRILSELLRLTEQDDYHLPAAAGAKLERKYRAFAQESAAHSSETELQAQQVERDCEDCYKAEYMKGHLGEVFDGVISAVTAYGFYVELDGGIEGLVRLETLPEGNYAFDEMMTLTETASHTSYRTGDPIRVECVRADVNAGQIDFVLGLGL